MPVFRRQKIQKKLARLFLVLIFVQSLVGLPSFVWAQGTPTSAGVNTGAQAGNTGATTSSDGSWTSSILSGFGASLESFFVGLLKSVRDLLAQYIASPAAAAFVWSVNPANISGPTGVLNLQPVYDLWKFIRDFFNLFFILILLFSAFATIFQVESFNIRNIFKNVILAALLINFSFPITRFLIDAANVPMYYFINDVLGGSGTANGGAAAMNQLLGYSGIASVMFLVNEQGDISKLLVGILFLFLFSISLFVLAALMFVRLIALTLLLIFSPFGFAASLLPGLRKYGSDWWSKFWNYALFGPAAALMLVVSIRFLGALGDQGGIFSSVTQVTANMTVNSEQSIQVAQVVFFMIPIILIWFTIGLANRFAIVGAATVVGLGMAVPRKMQAWTKDKIVRASRATAGAAVGTAKAVAKAPIAPLRPIGRGIVAGVKEGAKSGKWFGRDLTKIPGGQFLTGKYYKKAAENQEARVKGFVTGGKKGVADEIQTLEAKRQYEKADEYKKNNTSNSELEQKLRAGRTDEKTGKFIPSDAVGAAAAAMVLTDRGAVKSADDFKKALDSLGENTKEVGELIGKVDGSVFEEMNKGDVEKRGEAYERILGSQAFMKDASLKEAFEQKLKKDGEIKTRVDYEIYKNAKDPKYRGNATEARKAAYDTVLSKLSGDELARQGSLIQSMGGDSPDQALREYYKERMKNDKMYFQEAMKKMSQKDRQIWIAVESESGRVAQATAKAQPGENVSPGGIIIPGGGKTV
jgi:hypothetical protein